MVIKHHIESQNIAKMEHQRKTKRFVSYGSPKIYSCLVTVTVVCHKSIILIKLIPTNIQYFHRYAWIMLGENIRRLESSCQVAVRQKPPRMESFNIRTQRGNVQTKSKWKSSTMVVNDHISVPLLFSTNNGAIIKEKVMRLRVTSVW